MSSVYSEPQTVALLLSSVPRLHDQGQGDVALENNQHYAWRILSTAVSGQPRGSDPRGVLLSPARRRRRTESLPSISVKWLVSNVLCCLYMNTARRDSSLDYSRDFRCRDNKNKYSRRPRTERIRCSARLEQQSRESRFRRALPYLPRSRVHSIDASPASDVILKPRSLCTYLIHKKKNSSYTVTLLQS